MNQDDLPCQTLPKALQICEQKGKKLLFEATKLVMICYIAVDH